MHSISWESLVTIFITLITVIDPLGIIPVYLPIADKFSAKERKKIIFLSLLTATFVASVFLIAGNYIFKYLGISLDAMYISGGILLFIVGLEMMNAKPRGTRKALEEQQEIGTVQEVSVFPLAFPLIAGPGVIATVIMFTSNDNSWQHQLTIFCAMVVGFCVTGVVMLFAERLIKVFGKTGLSIIDRLVGVLLAALAVQFIINAVKNIIHNF